MALALAASAQDKPADKPADKPPGDTAKKEPPKPEQSVTQHSIVIGGVPVAYTATAGTLIVRNDKDEPWASMGYVCLREEGRGARDGRSHSPSTEVRAPPRCGSTWAHWGPAAS